MQIWVNRLEHTKKLLQEPPSAEDAQIEKLGLGSRNDSRGNDAFSKLGEFEFVGVCRLFSV